MPVTAKLSRKFYETFGDEIANELVEWFNQVDATYRSDLRELNELNFARFDARLEQRVADTNARIDKLAAELSARIDTVAAGLNAKIDTVAGELNARMDQVAADLTATLERRLGEQNRWLFAAWASLLLAITGLWMRG